MFGEKKRPMDGKNYNFKYGFSLAQEFFRGLKKGGSEYWIFKESK